MKLETYTTLELVRAYGEIQKELKSREVIRSKNVVGDLGEYIAINYYNKTPNLPNLQAAPTGTQNIDAISRNGDRYSIKSTTGNVTGVFYGLPNYNSDEKPIQKFEYVIIVKFGNNIDLEKIYELNWDQFLSMKKWHKRMQAWNLPVNNKLPLNSTIIFDSDKDTNFNF
ncbi:MAG: hypothetical protein C0602_06070 [Denitrovibrio sp.]|nr:MAG: hypothetical protein C0602_06070 [Denitrovibrio sp.]